MKIAFICLIALVFVLQSEGNYNLNNQHLITNIRNFFYLAKPRAKRDITCAAGGHKFCNISCKGRGWADGTCVWNTETGEFKCECAQERRGVR